VKTAFKTLKKEHKDVIDKIVNGEMAIEYIND